MGRRFLASLKDNSESSLSVHSLYFFLCKIWRHKVSAKVSFHGLSYRGLESGVLCILGQAGTLESQLLHWFLVVLVPHSHIVHIVVLGDGALLCLPGWA